MKSVSKNHVMFVLFVLVAAFALAAFRPLQVDTPPVDGTPVTLPPVSALSLVVILGAILSFLADYFPGLAAVFDTWTVSTKRVAMLIGAVAIVGVLFGGQCLGWFSTNLVCTPSGAFDVVSNIILAFLVGQGTHAGTKPTAEFKADTLNINPSKANKVGI